MAVEKSIDPTIPDPTPRQTSRRSRDVYAALQKEIVLGGLAPQTTVLELELAQRFQCSQGTIREALMQLSEAGLVNRQPHRGTHVASCRVADARALLTIRRDIECGYLARVLENTDDEFLEELHGQLNAMRNAAREQDEYLLSEHDRMFHGRLFAAADMPLVAPILTRCLIHNHRYKILNSETNRELDETAERHVPILEALRAANLDGLRSVLAHHISTIVDFGPDLTDTAAA